MIYKGGICNLRVRNKRVFTAVCFDSTASSSLDTYVLGGTGGWVEGYFLIHAGAYRRSNKQDQYSWYIAMITGLAFRSRMTFSPFVSNAYQETSFHYLTRISERRFLTELQRGYFFWGEGAAIHSGYHKTLSTTIACDRISCETET